MFLYSGYCDACTAICFMLLGADLLWFLLDLTTFSQHHKVCSMECEQCIKNAGETSMSDMF
jgi:hypothetical protein